MFLLRNKKLFFGYILLIKGHSLVIHALSTIIVFDGSMGLLYICYQEKLLCNFKSVLASC